MGKNRTLRYLDPACGNFMRFWQQKAPPLPRQSGVSFCKHKFAWAVWQMRICRVLYIDKILIFLSTPKKNKVWLMNNSSKHICMLFSN